MSLTSFECVKVIPRVKKLLRNDLKTCCGRCMGCDGCVVGGGGIIPAEVISESGVKIAGETGVERLDVTDGESTLPVFMDGVPGRDDDATPVTVLIAPKTI